MSHHPSHPVIYHAGKERGRVANRKSSKRTPDKECMASAYVLKEKAPKIKMTFFLLKILRILTVSTRMHGLGPLQWRPMQTLLPRKFLLSFVVLPVYLHQQRASALWRKEECCPNCSLFVPVLSCCCFHWTASSCCSCWVPRLG